MQRNIIHNSDQGHSYKFFSLMSAIYISILLLTMFIENRIILVGPIKILSGTLVIPLSYAISDVITEIYGYYEMRRLIWISIIVLYVIGFIVYIIMYLPTDISIQQNVAYNTLLTPFLKDIFTYSIAALIGIFLNSYLLSKWKILIAGRLFWLRSLGATMIGEAIFILIWGFLGFSYKFPIQTLVELMLASYLCKIIYNLIVITPSSLLVMVLRKVEGKDSCHDNIDFNPFAWKT